MTKKTKINIWMTVAIVFISTTLILSSVLAYLILKRGDIKDAEYICTTKTCSDAHFVNYDVSNDMCYCYDNTGDLIRAEYIRW